ncbi:hypothetical protein Ancab_037065 [Ancistrocladus abbreviatus]
MSRKKVLVVGGTGYLGQHLLQGFCEIQSGTSFDLAFTYHSNPPHKLLEALPQLLAFHVDLQTDHGFDSILHSFGQPDVVVNCAALSVPRACEVDPAAAMSINVPTPLVNWLSSFKEKSTLLIQLSTDQESKQMQLLLNVGGPDRVSRVQMADAVAQIRGYDTSLINPVSASTVNRGVRSPADISMDIGRLVETLSVSPVPYKEGVRLTLESRAGS